MRERECWYNEISTVIISSGIFVSQSVYFSVIVKKLNQIVSKTYRQIKYQRERQYNKHIISPKKYAIVY